MSIEWGWFTSSMRVNDPEVIKVIKLKKIMSICTYYSVKELLEGNFKFWYPPKFASLLWPIVFLTLPVSRLSGFELQRKLETEVQFLNVWLTMQCIRFIIFLFNCFSLSLSLQLIGRIPPGYFELYHLNDFLQPKVRRCQMGLQIWFISIMMCIRRP